MRLIDADKLIKNRSENDPIRIAAISAPTAFNVDNIIKQFEEQIKENRKIHSMARFEWLSALEMIKAELKEGELNE